VQLAGRSYRTDHSGRIGVEGLDPGPAALELSRDGYQLGSEAVSIVAGQRLAVAVRLLPAGMKAPSKLAGVVRIAAAGHLAQLREVTSKEGERAIFNVVLHRDMNSPP
jgi:hypothetical protein